MPAGYLMLDAWVAGRGSSSHENWAVIERAGNWSLAPSFDQRERTRLPVAEAEARNLSPTATAWSSGRGVVVAITSTADLGLWISLTALAWLTVKRAISG